jgi:hypothetical protein
MASSKFILVCTVNTDGGSVAGSIAPTGVAGNPQTAGAGAWGTVDNIAKFLTEEMLGRGINIRYADTAVSASTTGTFTAGAPTAGQALTVNGVAFTCRASNPAANEWVLSATPATNATNLAAAINASTTAGIINTVSASASGAVVTFTSVVPGPVGKNIAISENLDFFTLADTTFSTGGTQSHNATISAGA